MYAQTQHNSEDTFLGGGVHCESAICGIIITCKWACEPDLKNKPNI